jgi:hypothetical protein
MRLTENSVSVFSGSIVLLGIGNGSGDNLTSQPPRLGRLGGPKWPQLADQDSEFQLADSLTKGLRSRVSLSAVL